MRLRENDEIVQALTIWCHPWRRHFWP